jgi:hypothetical protein
MCFSELKQCCDTLKKLVSTSPFTLICAIGNRNSPVKTIWNSGSQLHILSWTGSTGDSFSSVGIVSHDTSLYNNIHNLIDRTFVDAIQRLFLPIASRNVICAIDLFACSINKNNPVLRMYSRELDVPIHFSTNKTGTPMRGCEQDWLMPWDKIITTIRIYFVEFGVIYWSKR